jgi:hypothetical protein
MSSSPHCSTREPRSTMRCSAWRSAAGAWGRRYRTAGRGSERRCHFAAAAGPSARAAVRTLIGLLMQNGNDVLALLSPGETDDDGSISRVPLPWSSEPLAHDASVIACCDLVSTAVASVVVACASVGYARGGGFVQ